MENLVPPVLRMVRELEWRLCSGQSMREAMRLYLAQDDSAFAQVVREWWLQYLQGQGQSSASAHFQTPLQQALLDLVVRGSQGQPTLEPLRALAGEIERAANAELEIHISTLPFKLLIPLLLLLFPAYLVVLLGPLLRDLQNQLGG